MHACMGACGTRYVGGGGRRMGAAVGGYHRTHEVWTIETDASMMGARLERDLRLLP